MVMSQKYRVKLTIYQIMDSSNLLYEVLSKKDVT